MEALSEITPRPWMGVYLRILALALGFGAFVHLANIAGFGEKPWLESPLAWRIGDLVYAPLNIVTAVGLWIRAPWGILLFLLLVASQFVIYTVFIDSFAFTLQHRQTIHALLGTLSLLVLGFIILALLKR